MWAMVDESAVRFWIYCRAYTKKTLKVSPVCKTA